MKRIRKSLVLLVALMMSATMLLTACNKNNGQTGNSSSSFSYSGTAPSTPSTSEKVVNQTKLTVYEGPSLMDSSEKVTVKVEEKELFVYETRVNHNKVFTWTYPKTYNQVVIFDFEGKVHMEVEVKGAAALTDVVVRPLSYGVKPTVQDNKISFDLEYSANYTVEYNDGTVTDPADNALHIFANPIETDPIDPENIPAGVVYIGPGVYSAGAIPLEDNQTLYLAGGAYVYGQVRAENLKNITIRGRGIISGSIFDRRSDAEYTLPFEFRFCDNVKMEGITVLDPAGWTVTLYHSQNIEIDNMHIITARGNGDGISVQSCKNVTVTGGFMRTFDDTLVVKNTDRGVTENITFDNVVVWTDLAQSMEVGYETDGATMKDITFKNITVLHNYHKAVISLHNADDADITNVVYESITVEDARMLGDNQTDGLDDYLIDFFIDYNAQWSKSSQRGTVNGVRIENVKVLEMADSIVCRINGYNNQKKIQNVTIVGVEIEGKVIDTAEKLKLNTNGYADNISVGKVNYDVFGAALALPYTLELTSDEVQKTIVSTKVQQGLEVPDFSILDIQETYMGQARNMEGVSAKITQGQGDTARVDYQSGGDFSVASNPVSNLFDGDRNTTFKAQQWRGDNLEFAALSIDFGELLPAGSIGVMRIYLAENSPFVYDFDISAFNKPSVTGDFTARIKQIERYSASPATGNYFDITFKPDLETCGLQLRFFRVDGMTGQKPLEIAEIEFYPCSIATGDSNKIISSTPHYDVYDKSNLNDGDVYTYWETSPSNVNGAYFTVDLGATYTLKYIVMHLPPVLTWEPRDQKITILVSDDNVNWRTAVAETTYTFDPKTGNANTIELPSGISGRYVKLVWSENSSSRYGAQLSELYIYA